MKVELQYGAGTLPFHTDAEEVTVLAPTFTLGLVDESQAFNDAVAHPVGSEPLQAIVRPTDRVAVVIADGTRPLPSDRLLPMLFGALAHVPADRFTVIIGTGTHRAVRPDEVERLVGADIARSHRIVNHDACDDSRLSDVGSFGGGQRLRMCRDYVEADRRIVIGFIEPHFMAGYSGGYKGVFPAVAAIDSILHYHRAAVIGHPKSTWGVLDGNPTQALIREAGALAPADFLVNVTLNRDRAITGIFAGDVLKAHARGCRVARATAMVPCREPFDVVVTTGSGHPLDQNLYQAVKGMSAGAMVVADDGLIVTAARCADGFPDHGNFRSLLKRHGSADALLAAIRRTGYAVQDQWQAQLLALIMQRARVAVFSEIPADQIAAVNLQPVDDVDATVAAELRRLGSGARLAVLPEGPQTIPFIDG